LKVLLGNAAVRSDMVMGRGCSGYGLSRKSAVVAIVFFVLRFQQLYHVVAILIICRYL
jgi:hypothetical protein